MSETTLVLSLGITLAAVLVWLVAPRRSSGPTLSGNPNPEIAFPKHYRYFPQIRQALSRSDEEYLRASISSDGAEKVLEERRTVARSFLRGLHDDFTSLERLARVVAGLSPTLNRRQESERIFLGFRFRVLYSLIRVRLSVGRIPLQQIDDLTGIIGILAVRMERAMAEVSAISAERLTSNLSV